MLWEMIHLFPFVVPHLLRSVSKEGGDATSDASTVALDDVACISEVQTFLLSNSDQHENGEGLSSMRASSFGSLMPGGGGGGGGGEGRAGVARMQQQNTEWEDPRFSAEERSHRSFGMP